MSWRTSRRARECASKRARRSGGPVSASRGRLRCARARSALVFEIERFGRNPRPMIRGKKNRDLGRVDRAFLGSIGNPGEARPINARLEKVASLKPAASSDLESLPESKSAPPSNLANFAPPRAGNQRGPVTTTLALPVCTASRALHFVATERESNVSTRTPRAVPRPCTMASQAVVSAVAASPVASQPRGATAGRASGFLSGGLKVPRRSAFARSNAKPVRAVTRAADEVRNSSHGALRASAGARHRRCREPRPQGSAVCFIWMDRKAERG